ncbi:AGAP012701-PA, partial [Anopheles gambiae str. PEST]
IPSEPCIAASAYGAQMPSSIATMPSSTGSLYTMTPPTSVAVTSSIVSSTRMATATLLPSGTFIRTVAPSTPAQTTYVVASSTATTSTVASSHYIHSAWRAPPPTPAPIFSMQPTSIKFPSGTIIRMVQPGVNPQTNPTVPVPSIGMPSTARLPCGRTVQIGQLALNVPGASVMHSSGTATISTAQPSTNPTNRPALVSVPSLGTSTAPMLPYGTTIRTIVPSATVTSPSTTVTATAQSGTSYSDDTSASTSTVYATSLQMAASSLHSPVSALRPSVKPLPGTTKATPIASYSSGRSTAPSIHITSIELLPSLTMTPPESPQIKSIGSDSATSQLAVSRCTQPSTSGILIKDSSVVPTKSKSGTITENLPTAAIVSSETSQNLDSSISSLESMVDMLPDFDSNNDTIPKNQEHI